MKRAWPFDGDLPELNHFRLKPVFCGLKVRLRPKQPEESPANSRPKSAGGERFLRAPGYPRPALQASFASSVSAFR
jgi:hypothetical protein